MKRNFLLFTLIFSIFFSLSVSSQDDCSTAIAIVVGGLDVCTPTAGDNTGATASGELPDPTCGSFGAGQDSWYRFVVPASGNVTIEMNDNGGPADYVMSIYSGTCGALAQVECDDDDGDGTFPKVELTGQNPGDILFARIFEYANDDAGPYNICAYDPAPPPPPPANDECANAIALTVNPDYACGTVTVGTIESATDSGEIGGCSGTANDDVWYSFVATSTDHRITLQNINGSTTDLYHRVTDACIGGADIVCSDPNTSNLTGLVPGTTYYLQVYSWANATHDSTFDICVGTPPPAPPNDECAGATPYPGDINGNCITGFDFSAYTDSGTDSPSPTCDFGGDAVAWFTWTAPVTTNAGDPLNLFFNSGDCAIGIEAYETDCTTTATNCLGNVDGVLSGFVQGNDYLLLIYQDSPGTANCDFCLTDASQVGCTDITACNYDPGAITDDGSCIAACTDGSCPGDPCTDGFVGADCNCYGAGATCANAVDITSVPFSVSGNTADFGDDYDTNPCGNSYLGGDDYIMTFTPAATDSYNLTATNLDTWTGLLVFDGCPDDPTTNCVADTVSSASGTKSIENLELMAGTTYYIIISTWPTPQSTNFDFTLNAGISGCTDPGACNFDPAATADNGLCFNCPLGCPGDSCDTEGGIYDSDCNCVPPPPANDECVNAKLLSCGDTLIGETNVSSTDNGDVTGCSIGPGVWYSIVGTGEDITIDVTNVTGGLDAEIAVASTDSDCSGTLTNVDCVDAGFTGDLPESVTFTSTDGITYLIFVGDYGSTAGTEGVFDVTVTCGTIPPATECPTYTTSGGPYVVFTLDDPNPSCDVNVPDCATFQAWANESYIFDPVPNNAYEYNFCNDCDGNAVYSNTLWGGDALITVGNDTDNDGTMDVIIATGTGCSINFTAPDANAIIIHITAPGPCGQAELTQDNGFPTLTNLGGGAIICDAEFGLYDPVNNADSTTPVFSCPEDLSGINNGGVFVTFFVNSSETACADYIDTGTNAVPDDFGVLSASEGTFYDSTTPPSAAANDSIDGFLKHIYLTQSEIDNAIAGSGGIVTIGYQSDLGGCTTSIDIDVSAFGGGAVDATCVPEPTDCASSSGSTIPSPLCSLDDMVLNLGTTNLTGDQNGFSLVYDVDISTTPTLSEIYGAAIGSASAPTDLQFYNEFFDGLGGGNTDLSAIEGYVNTDCEILDVGVYIIPANITDSSFSAECAAEGPIIMSFYPDLQVTISGEGTCAPTATLNTLDESGFVITECASAGDSSTDCSEDLSYDFTADYVNANCLSGDISGTITCTCGCQNPPTISADATATVCEGSDLDLSMVNASFGGGANSASWSTSGDGSIFFPNYTPGSGDIAAGTVTLTFSTDDPDGAGVCEAASTQLVLTITSPEFPTGLACYQMATLDPATCTYTISGEQDPEPATACYETATFNDATCVWDVTGEQDPEPATACYETATFNDATCVWDVTGEQDPEPATACYETATFNDATCVWDVTGEQDPEPATACYETATFNDVTCAWDVTGEQDPEPATACYETATFNDATCVWDVTGEQDPEPATACYETAVFNDATCMWDVTGEQPAEPTTACYETATFNDATCVWDVSGELPPQPTNLACYQSVGAFNDATCMWDVNGEEPVVDDGCDLTADSYDPVTCAIINEASCPEGTSFNSVDCSCDTDVVPGCTDPCATNYNPGANSDDGSCTLPEAPTTACYETATFNTTTCMWEVSGDQPEAPTTGCYETATFNDDTCTWEVSGDQPEAPATACYETAAFNADPAVCAWEISGDQPAAPATACYETATFNGDAAVCAWEVSGDQPEAPATACYETATFNGETCMWDVSGEEPVVDDGCDVTTDSYDAETCEIINTPDCPEGTSYNSVDCSCDTDVVTGCTDPCATNYDPGANSDDGSCTLPEAPATACYETATFNTETCMWDVTGEEPVVDDGCDVTIDAYDAETCVVSNTPDCPEGTTYNAEGCSCDEDVIPCDISSGEIVLASTVFCDDELIDFGATTSSFPVGYSVTYILSGNGIIIDTSNSATEFPAQSIAGNYQIHLLISSSILDLSTVINGTTPVAEIESLLIQGGGSICGSLTISGGEITVQDCTDPCEVTAGTISADVSSVCVGDAIVNVTIDDAGSSESSLFVITDGDGTMILATQDISNTALDLSGAPAGTCQIWLLNYDGEITLPASGMVADLVGCFALSNAIDILREDCVEKGSISSTVYNDTNRDGVQGVDEPGIEGVTVNLIDGDGNIVDSTTTDADGNYSFSEVEPGNYTVQVVYTGDLVSTGSGSYDVTVGSGEDVVAESDFGFAEEEQGFNCDDLIVMVSGTCNDSDSQYQLTITIEGAFGDSYTVSSASDDAMNGSTVGGSFTTDFFDAGAAFDYMITSVNNPDCSVTVSASQFVCTVTAIELIDFDGRTVDTNNEIFWTTATETDNDYFTLQRSEDGINFEVVDLINGAGNSSTPTAYTFVDVDAPATSYYRLLATDFAGVTEIVSDVISLNRSNDVTVEVYPVPASDVLNIELGSISEDFTVVVIDITGKVVKSTDFDGNQNEINLDITDLSTGTYFLQVQQTNGEFITTKFIKE